MTKILAGISVCLLALLVLAFWQSSRSEKKAQDLAQQLAAAQFQQQATKLHAEGLERELKITGNALSLRDAQYKRAAGELDKRKKTLMEIRDDACLDQPVPAGLFGGVQHTPS